MRWLHMRRLLLLSYLLVFAVGCAAFLVNDRPAPATPQWPNASPHVNQDGLVNWASLWSGGRVRVSIWDHFRNHHPLYLIDGQQLPSETEKWASLGEQSTPWLELLLDGYHDLSRVDLYHAGWREGAELTNVRYFIRC